MVMLLLVDNTTVDFSAGVVVAVAVVGRRVLRDRSERGVDELSISREADETVDLSAASLRRNVVVVVKVTLLVAKIGVSDISEA